MKYTKDGKTVNIPDAELRRLQKTLDLTVAEAVEVYLSDEGIEVDEEVTELTAKAKTAGAGAKALGERKERKAPVRKPDELKRTLIAALAEFLETNELCAPEGTPVGVEITNIERMIAFEVGDEKFEVTLTKKRAPKK